MNRVLLWLFLLVVALPVQAQRLIVPGANPQCPAIRNARTAEEAVAIAKSKGWEIFQLQRAEVRTSYGASGWDYVRGLLPAGTWMAIDAERHERVIGYTDHWGRWRGCGNQTERTYIVQSKVKIEIRERIVEAPQPIYVFGPTVYPTAPMPQPQVTYVARPPVYVNLWWTGDSGNSGNGDINLFAQGGSNANVNANMNRNFVRGGNGGSVVNQNNNAANANATTNNANTSVQNAANGDAGGNTQIGP